MKKILGLVLGLSVGIAGCSKQETPAPEAKATDTAAVQTVTIASTGSDADIWRHIASLPETKEAGLKLDIKNFTDYVAMNTAVANKEIYSSKVKKLEEFKQGATIAIPNDGANESRALLLLQSAGLVKLKADFDNVKGTTADVSENAKQIVIKPIQMATAVRVKDEVDAIVLGNTLAMEGGLNVLKDAIYYEPIDQSTKMNVNILATSADRQNDPVLQKVGALYHTEAVKQFVQEKFAGTKVDVNKPISYLTESK